MQRFVIRKAAMPAKRPATLRRGDFGEIYGAFGQGAAAEQANRCAQCGVPFCQIQCPLHNNIPDWLMLAGQNRMEEAFRVASATNNMPEICGRICPQDKLCEGSCVIEQAGHGTVTIGAIERHIVDTAWDQGWVKPPTPLSERAERVAVIGAGPGGLAAAEELRRAGVQVEVFDSHDRPGGLLIYGIPNFKLEKHLVRRRTDLLQAAGILLHQGVRVGRDVTFEELRRRFDAVVIATGVYQARSLDLPGLEHAALVQALDYLIASNRKGLGDAVAAFEDGRLDARGKRVVVVGGGDTAMDCVRTAIRQGASAVTCVYRRDRANMPGSAREVDHAMEEGVAFDWLAQPDRVVAGRDGVKLSVRRMRLGAPDASGRQTPEPADGAPASLAADLVIAALGFEAENLRALFGCPDLPLTPAGTVAADPETQATALEGVYAVGDIVRGASLVVSAIRDGRAAAHAIVQNFKQPRPAARPRRAEPAGALA